MTEITYRFRDDPHGRPSQTDIVDDHEVESTKQAITEHGGIVTGTRKVSWQEQLAAMENNPE